MVNRAVPQLPRWTAADLKAVPARAERPVAGCLCTAAVAGGWESLAAPLAAPTFVCVATLCDADAPGEATLSEWHPAGTSFWSATAPIAVDWFPYNRCSVWRCTRCGLCFLQYTEYGGYYVDHRVRPVDPALVV